MLINKKFHMHCATSFKVIATTNKFMEMRANSVQK
jgi:hypothetical protein